MKTEAGRGSAKIPRCTKTVSMGNDFKSPVESDTERIRGSLGCKGVGRQSSKTRQAEEVSVELPLRCNDLFDNGG